MKKVKQNNFSIEGVGLWQCCRNRRISADRDRERGLYSLTSNLIQALLVIKKFFSSFLLQELVHVALTLHPLLKSNIFFAFIENLTDLKFASSLNSFPN